jgi:histone-lysine N-methyltransferase SETD3
MPNNDPASLNTIPQHIATGTLIDSEDLKMQRLLHWLREEGAIFPSVRIEVGKEGRVALAAAPIKAGSLVMHIPHALMITSGRARDSEIGKLIASGTNGLPDYAHMAAYLLDLKREGGPWKCYLDVLPKTFPEHSYFFSESELQYLNGCYDLPKLLKSRAGRHREYRDIISCLPQERAFTRDEYEWARCAALSRTHSTAVDGEISASMIPLADMLNHSPERNLEWRREATLGFVYTAVRDIETGEALTTSYGAQCNGRFFIGYGFCLESNPDNVTELQLPDLSPDHPCVEHAKGFGTVRDGMRVFLVRAAYDHAGTAILFSYLRLSALNDASRVSLDKSGSGVATVGAISVENEQAALTGLAQACRQRMEQFDTSIEQDQALLGDKCFPLKLRNAVLVRHGEKVVLKYFLDLAEAAMPVVQVATRPQKYAEYFKHLLPLLSASS